MKNPETPQTLLLLWLVDFTLLTSQLSGIIAIKFTVEDIKCYKFIS